MNDKARQAINPYVDGRKEWLERYGDYIEAAQSWRRIAIITGLTALLAVCGVIYIGSQNKIVPYVVQVSELGQTL
ncbi:MAG: conjugal transfer protein TrbF, partial [Rhizobiaceae bacterium]|nr:conjugal transfer protein TrbF [Rhizobiaceae bacterium]